MYPLFKQFVIAATITALTPSVASAQCKYVRESKDAFSGETVKKAADLAIGPWMWTMTLEQRNDKYFIGLKILQSGDIRYILGKGEKVWIKLENGKLLELEMDRDYPPVAQAMGGTIVTLWVTNTEVDEKMMKRLSNSPITDVKTIIQGVDVVLPKVKGRQAEAIMNSASCILYGKSDS